MKDLKQYFYSLLSSTWCKEVLFIAPNMAPSRELLYYSSSIINVYFQGTIRDIIHLLSLLKNIVFRCVLFQMYYSYSNLKFKKRYLLEFVSTIWYLLEYHRPNFSITWPYRGIFSIIIETWIAAFWRYFEVKCVKFYS